MNNENLIVSMRDRTPEQRREAARKAGKASGIARAERKSLKELLLMCLEDKNEEGYSNSMLMTKAILERAKNGDVKAFETIRDTIGEKPTDKVEMSSEGIQLIINGKGTD